MQEKLTKGSQTYLAALILTLTGGYLDAYTYYARGGVFANAQTGNIIKLGLRMAEGRFSACLNYLIPICAFTLGVTAVLVIESVFRRFSIRYIRRMVILAEIIAFAAAAFVPLAEETNIIANTLVSFGCAMQMEAFRSFGGEVIATTVSTGNLRKAIEYLYKAFTRKKAEDLSSALRCIVIVFVFIGGVFLGAVLTPHLSALSILVPCALLAVLLVIITIRYRQILRAENAQ